MSGAPDRVLPAARGFDRIAEAYERGRPDYPKEAVDWLAEGLVAPGRTLVELAAGTGKLTRALLPTGARIVAVEPSEGMRSVFRREVPTVELLDGTAERIPWPDHGADAVVVGQAFHWFRFPEALSEIARVLRPAGRVGLIWNRRDESVPWVRAIGRIVEARERRGAPRSDDGSWQAAVRSDRRFGELSNRSFPFTARTTVDRIVDRVVSVSFVALEGAEASAAVAREVVALLDRDPMTRGRDALDFPYRTDAYRFDLVG
ncbi:MAG TPA: class I SAM-dependent methyltransferase [Thermoplasmata archaeon]|nr:class I SAM-dependent methyltransferase [Thermoplasmata archaeon]